MGSQNVKQIRKEMNDNADGKIDFLPEAQSFNGEYSNTGQSLYITPHYNNNAVAPKYF